jgi:hypothetical protein
MLPAHAFLRRSGTTLLFAALATLAAISAAGCGGERGAEAEPPQLALQPPAGEAEDTFALHMSRLQRRLVNALVAADSAALAGLLDVGSQAADLRDPPPPSLLDRTRNTAAFNYYEILAGRLAPRLSDEFSEFETLESRGQTVSFAFAPEQAVRTTWRQADGRWVAARLVITTRVAGLRQLEEERAGR